jgi:hypothetical protein
LDTVIDMLASHTNNQLSKTLEEMDELFGDQVIGHKLDGVRPEMTARGSSIHDANAKHDLKHVE